MTRHATILLVDDSKDDIELMCLALARSHAPVRFACVTQGSEAIAYLSRREKYADREQFPEPAIVLLDLAMPAMNGFDVLRWMQQQSVPMPPAFVLTCSQLESDARLARDLGAAAFITKPMDLEGTIVLIESMQNFWTWHAPEREPADPPTIVGTDERRIGSSERLPVPPL